MVPSLTGFVLTPLNKMVMQDENIITFLMLSAPLSFLPLFLSAFRVQQHSLLFTPLIVFLLRVFSSFLCSLPQILPFLLIFSSLFILNLWRILQHRLPLQKTHLRFCPRHMTRLSWILWHHSLLSLLLVLTFIALLR